MNRNGPPPDLISSSMTERQSEANQFKNPRDIAVAKHGRTVFVSDFDNRRVSIWRFA